MCTKKEMKFSVFLIHQVAEKWQKTPAEVYQMLEDTGILDGYVLACYDTLHTQGAESLVEDITEFAKERGAQL